MSGTTDNVDVQSLEAAERFLIERTKGVRHSGRDFIEHLRGTYQILKERGNPEYVCVAGLFHSIYGTNSFKCAVVSISERVQIQSLIGNEAEMLVYIFCTWDRPKAFIDCAADLHPQTFRDLIEIEIANLMEQSADPRLVWRLEFERCWPWLEASLLEGSFERPDGSKWLTHTKEDVWQRISTRKSKFWPFHKCAFLTEFRSYPTGLKDQLIWLAGGELKEIKEKEPEIAAFGKANGCHRQTGFGRDGWARAFPGYTITGSRKHKSLL